MSSSRSRFLRLLLAPLIALPILFLLGIGLHAWNSRRLDLPGFEKRMQAHIERAVALSDRAASFDQDEALRELGVNPINGPLYRFDERWTEARVATDDALTSAAVPAQSRGVRLDFEDGDLHHFDHDFSEFAVEDGVLRTTYAPKKLLKSVEPFEIPWNDIAIVRFRMKVERAEHVEFAFARGLVPVRTRIYEPQFGLITVDVIPDGEFHTYEVNARDAFEFDFGGTEQIQRLFFRPSNVDGDEVEIDYIHILRRKERYVESPFGVSFETFETDSRPVLYMATPLGLEYDVEVPTRKPELRFGLGMLDETDPVTFRLTLRSDDRSVELYNETHSWQDAWTDVTLPMDEWAGQKVGLEFSAVSAGGNIAFWSNPVLAGAPERRFNIVVLLEDTLRADHLSAYGYHRPTSPVKEAMAAEGVLFETNFSQATETRPSCPTIMTSLYPTGTGVWYFTNRLSERYLTLPEILRSQGFETAGFIHNNHAGRIAGLHQGYGNFRERYNLNSGAKEIYNKHLRNWLDKNAHRNFFLYLHVLDPHDPYEPKPPHDAWSLEPSVENPGKPQEGFELDRSNYDGEILANDEAFGRFLDDLKARGLLDDTLIVFLSDHGEFFGEHGGLQFHIPPAYAQVLHVPLIMRYPKALPSGLRVRTPTGSIDVAPTLLELAEVDTGPLLLQGDSLLPIIEAEASSPDPDRLIVSDDVRDMSLGERMGWGSVLFGDWHLINSRRYVDSTGMVPEPRFLPQFWLFRLHNYGADPEEKRQDIPFLLDPLSKRRVQRQIDLLHAANGGIRAGITRGEEAESSYDPETLERLRKLGYID